MKMSISQSKGKQTKDKAFMGNIHFILYEKATKKPNQYLNVRSATANVSEVKLSVSSPL